MRVLGALVFALIAGSGEARRDPRHAGKVIADKIELSERVLHHAPADVKKTEKVENVKMAKIIPQTEAIKSMSKMLSG